MPRRADLDAAYHAARYCIVVRSRRCTITIGTPDRRIDRLLRRSGCDRHWCLLTPCNPGSLVLTPVQNRGRLQRLQHMVRRHGWPALPAINDSADGNWIEPGLCLLDAPPRLIHRFARCFGQAAWVFGRLDAAPQLVWTDRPLSCGDRCGPSPDQGRCGRGPAV